MGSSHNEGLRKERKEYFLSKCMKASQIRDSWKTQGNPRLYGLYTRWYVVYTSYRQYFLSECVSSWTVRSMTDSVGSSVQTGCLCLSLGQKSIPFFIWLRILVIKTILNWRWCNGPKQSNTAVRGSTGPAKHCGQRGRENRSKRIMHAISCWSAVFDIKELGLAGWIADIWAWDDMSARSAGRPGCIIYFFYLYRGAKCAFKC